MKELLDIFWPGTGLERQLRKTWYTNAVLCSAGSIGGTIEREVEDICGNEYLRKQIDLFTSAYVVALGWKAEKRMRRIGIRYDRTAFHPSFRGSNEERQNNWEDCAVAFKEWLATPDRVEAHRRGLA